MADDPSPVAVDLHRRAAVVAPVAVDRPHGSPPDPDGRRGTHIALSVPARARLVARRELTWLRRSEVDERDRDERDALPGPRSRATLSAARGRLPRRDRRRRDPV